jgi:hypothetical protein
VSEGRFAGPLDALVRQVVEEALTEALARIGHPTTVPAKPYVDDRDLAELTPLKRVTWQQMRAAGTGPPFTRQGRRCIYAWSDVVAWLAEDHDEL